MKILVLGGTGFISRSLVVKLLEGGHQVTIFNRGKSPNGLPQNPNLKAVVGDRERLGDLQGCVKHTTFDALYDFLAYQPQQSEMAVKVFRGKTGRFIHCSTISVYLISYEVQCPISEDQDKADLMPFWAGNPFGMKYGIDKRGCEKVLWQGHHDNTFPVSMLRPTFVSGPRDPAQRDYFWIQRILDGKPLLIGGSGDFAFQQVYVEDVATAFTNLLENPVSVGQAYNVAAEEIFSLNEYLKKMGRLLGREPEIVQVDQDIFDRLTISNHHAGNVFPFNTRRTAVFSLDKIKRDLNNRSTPFAEWMPRTIEWFTKQYRRNSFGYERRKEELDFIQQWREHSLKLQRKW